MGTVKQVKWDSFDVLKGILAGLDEEVITTEVPLLHQALYDLAQNKRYSQYLRQYRFEKRSFFPFASELSTDISNLELSGQLSATNPGFTTYTILPKLTISFQQHTLPLFSPKEQQDLREMAQEFRRKLKAFKQESP